MSEVRKRRGRSVCQAKMKKKFTMTPRKRAIAVRFVRRYPALAGRQEDLSAYEEKILIAVQKALLRIEPEYRNGVLDNILFGISRYNLEKKAYASEATWQRKREKLLRYVAIYGNIR